MKVFKLITTGLGTGYSSIAPGTIGSALGIVMYFIVNFIFASFELQFWSVLILNLLFILVLLFAGVFSINQVHKIWEHDSQKIVIDEIVGVGFAILAIPFSWQYYLLAFVLFRFFDIAKPLFIRRIDSRKGSWSVMFDDVLAGVYSNVVLQLVVYHNVL